MATDKMSQERLEQILKDLEWEGEWRSEADRAAAYYDGNQLSSTVLGQMRDRGLPPLIRNLVGPTIDLVLGIEAKAKRDWQVMAHGIEEENVDIGLAMGAELSRAETSSGADLAISDAFASSVKSGIGWVEVARESNPFRPKYRVRNVHRREVYWDFRAKETDLSDARYLVRKQWIDEDVAILFFPRKATLIRNATARWADWDEISISAGDIDLAASLSAEQRSTIEETEWRDTDRKRVCIYEVWYRHWRAAPVIVFPSGEVLEFDENNPAHLYAVASNNVQVSKAVFPKVRLSWWCGPHFLEDVPSPYPHGYFPYVPFWAYREDVSGVPYGLIRRMMSPQDEINARLAKMMWLLTAKRVIADSDAADMPWHEVIEEAARPDSVILMNPNRKNKNADALRIESDFALSQQQFNVLQDATKAIQDAAGVYQSMLGKSEYAGQSGIAISNLVEQGSTTLAELTDNYQYARKLVGTLLLSLVKEDIGANPYTISVDFNGTKRAITLNEQIVGPDGQASLTNDLAHTQLSVEVEDVPDTPTFRMQQLQMLTEVTKSLPPEMQVLLADFMVRSTDLPNRHEIADRIANALGLGGQNQEGNVNSPEAQAAAQEQAMMEMQQQQMSLQMAKQQAEVEKAQAEVEATRLKTQQAMANEAMKAQMMQQKLVHAEDTHQLTMDEKASGMVRAAEASTQDALIKQGRFVTDQAAKKAATRSAKPKK